MKITAVICEYNPLHNGHRYQLSRARQKTGADHIVAIISGNFVQRGEPAIFDKWTRTEMALRAGADLVVQLPTANVLTSAEFYASAAVEMAYALNVTDFLSFGCAATEEEYDKLRELAKDPEYDKKGNLDMSGGTSYAAAMGKILSSSGERIHPNDILALEYLKALNRNRSSGDKIIEPVNIKRIRDENTCSASDLRNKIRSGENIDKYVPEDILPCYKNKKIPSIEAYSQLILYSLRSMSPEELSHIKNVSEGLEYKIHKEAMNSNTVGELIQRCTSLRYTSSRIRRILLCAILNITKEDSEIQCIRILGAKKDSGPLIKEIRENCRLPIVTKAVQYPLRTGIIESKASDVYVLGYDEPESRVGDREYREPAVYI